LHAKTPNRRPERGGGLAEKEIQADGSRPLIPRNRTMPNRNHIGVSGIQDPVY